MARQNFTCCQTCGLAEIDDEIEVVRAEGRPVRGYAFFHQQDTAGAVEGGSLCHLVLDWKRRRPGERNLDLIRFGGGFSYAPNLFAECMSSNSTEEPAAEPVKSR